MDDLFAYLPAGSLVLLPDEQRVKHIQNLVDLPRNLRQLSTSMKIASYLKGMTRNFNLAPAQGEYIALIVFQVTTGEYTLAAMPTLLSSTLRIANDKAQKIAQEIERDIFAPVALELNQYLAQKKSKAGSITEKLGIPATSPAPPPVQRQASTFKPNPARLPLARGPESPKFPRRPAAPPNILNLKDKQKPSQPPFIG